MYEEKNTTKMLLFFPNFSLNNHLDKIRSWPRIIDDYLLKIKLAFVDILKL